MSPFLKIGATFASFQSFGTWPVWSDLLKMISSIGDIWWRNSLRTVGGMVSGPAALCGFRLGRICSIPVAEMVYRVVVLQTASIIRIQCEYGYIYLVELRSCSVYSYSCLFRHLFGF